MTENFFNTTIPIPSYFYDKDYNVDATEDEDGVRLSPINELTEYLIQFRSDDLVESMESMEFFIDIDENPIIFIILAETLDKFRNILRDAVTASVILVNYNRNDVMNIRIQNKKIRNNIKINFKVPVNITLGELTASDYEGEIVTFEAKVSYWSKKRTITHMADYKCPDCNYVVTKPFKAKVTVKCPEDNVLCEFYKPRSSEDVRRITLRELNNDFTKGKLPISITADIYGKTVGEVELSDNVITTGIFRSVPLKLQDGKINREFIPTIQAISVQNIKTDKMEMPSMELMKKFKDLEKEGKLVEAIIDGFAYNVYKKRNEKKAVICSLIGSKWIGQRGNGNPPMIHILFVGDPDTYKSTIMKYIIRVSDNCVLADSTTVSNAGMKAIAIKADDGGWVIMAGLLPTYNRGNIHLDEFGDLSPSIYADLKDPMVVGWVSKHVAGEDFEGMAETGILASMNPVEGVYDTTKTLFENLSVLKKPLITRFDLIVKFSSDFKNLYGTQIDAHFDKCDALGHKPDDLLTDNEIKLFLNYVRTIDPKVTREALSRNTEFFAKIKEKSEDKKSVETRTKNAVMKFAVALARWHMSNEVLPQHVDESINLYKEGLATFGMHFEDGEFINEASLKKTEDGRRIAIKKAYDGLKDEEGYAFKDDIIDKALDYGCFVNRCYAETIMNKLVMEGATSEKNKKVKISW